jgi:hypothetical protein
MSADALFEAPAPVVVAAAPTTPGERRRARQHEAITQGAHPLGLALRRPIALHPEAVRSLDPALGGPRCGGCRFRVTLKPHDRAYPKCTQGAVEHTRVDEAGKTYRWHTYPRVSSGLGTDVRAYWPACAQFEAAP